jgi:hypothetical protein
MKLIMNVITLGNRHNLAILFYLGFGLIFTAITPGFPNIFAEVQSCGGESACEEGMVCCGEGTCCYTFYT